MAHEKNILAGNVRAANTIAPVDGSPVSEIASNYQT
jgi:hypothetical protein